MAGRNLISAADAERIADAIQAAEAKTAGEIIAVVTPESSSYLYAPFMWAAILALLVPWPLIQWTWWPSTWVYLAQLIAFLVLLPVLMPRGVRRLLVPAYVKRQMARRRAREQFLAQNLHLTDKRTGVLIFVSVAERYAEIIADQGVHERVPPGTWDGIVRALTREIGAGDAADGFVHAIEAVGRHLAQHFPPGALDADELPNRLIVLSDEG